MLLSKVLPVKFFEDIILLFHHNKCYTACNYSPDPIMSGKKFYEPTYDTSLWMFLNSYNEKVLYRQSGINSYVPVYPKYISYESHTLEFLFYLNIWSLLSFKQFINVSWRSFSGWHTITVLGLAFSLL